MQPVPQELVELVRKTAPAEAEIVPLSWAFEDEDYNIAVGMPDTVERVTARQIEEQLIEAVLDWDATHGTFTLCKVWREREMARRALSQEPDYESLVSFDAHLWGRECAVREER